MKCTKRLHNPSGYGRLPTIIRYSQMKSAGKRPCACRRNNTLRRFRGKRDCRRMNLWRSPPCAGAEGASLRTNLSGKRTEAMGNRIAAPCGSACFAPFLAGTGVFPYPAPACDLNSCLPKAPPSGKLVSLSHWLNR